MKPRWAIFRKEFRDIFNERTIIVAVLIQVFVAGLSSFLVVGLSALTDPSAIPTRTEPTVTLAGPEPVREALLEAGLSGEAAPSAEAATAAFLDGRADAALIVDDPPTNGTTVRFRLLLPDGDIRATLTLVHVKDAMQAYERTLRQDRADRLVFDPIHVQTDVPSSSYEFAYTLLVPLLVFLPVVLAGALTADSLTEEIQRRTLPVLMTSPATAADVVEGKILANASIAPILTAAWLGLLYLNDLPVPLAEGVLIVVLATAGAILMCLLAALAGLWSRDRNKAQVLYTQGMLVLLIGTLLLPASPVNVVGLLAAGSATPVALGTVVAAAALAVAGLAGLRLVLGRRRVRWAVLDAGS